MNSAVAINALYNIDFHNRIQSFFFSGCNPIDMLNWTSVNSTGWLLHPDDTESDQYLE
jgi:hypothetical protein